MWGSKKEKKEYLKGENCQEGLWQKKYLDGQINNMMRNTGED